MKNIITIIALTVCITATAQFGPSLTTYFPISNTVPAASFLIVNTSATNNANVSVTNAPAMLNSYVISDFYSTATNAVNWTSNNLYSGIVKLKSGSASYFITNAAFGTNSLAQVSILDDDATITSAKALNIATNVIQFKANGNAAADCRLGWKLISK